MFYAQKKHFCLRKLLIFWRVFGLIDLQKSLLVCFARQAHGDHDIMCHPDGSNCLPCGFLAHPIPTDMMVTNTTSITELVLHQ
mmetsp:Transcript_36987/g.78892  ORF Transcript_36987/g.78892 Transcript_36987/m.78892 type:complete len:83 (+) Transcript_36987:301-549(+)